MGTNSISITVHESPQEAPKYEAPEHLHATLIQAVVVKRGTLQGNPTIDLVFRDDKGQKYISMITARLLKMVVDTNNELN